MSLTPQQLHVGKLLVIAVVTVTLVALWSPSAAKWVAGAVAAFALIEMIEQPFIRKLQTQGEAARAAAELRKADEGLESRQQLALLSRELTRVIAMAEAAKAAFPNDGPHTELDAILVEKRRQLNQVEVLLSGFEQPIADAIAADSLRRCIEAQQRQGGTALARERVGELVREAVASRSNELGADMTSSLLSDQSISGIVDGIGAALAKVNGDWRLN